MAQWPLSAKVRKAREREPGPPKPTLPKPRELVEGEIVGFLQILYEREDERKGRWYACKCIRKIDGVECGVRKVLRASDLRSFRVISCGCYHRDAAGKRLSQYRNKDAPSGFKYRLTPDRGQDRYRLVTWHYNGKNIPRRMKRTPTKT